MPSAPPLRHKALQERTHQSSQKNSRAQTTVTLIRTAILNGVDPEAWLTDVLEQMVSGKVNSRSLTSLLPWAWRDAKCAAVAA